MSAEVNQAARVTGPVSAADATMRTGGGRIAVTGAAQTLALPTSGAVLGKKNTMASRFIRIVAVGVNVQLAQGLGSAPTVVLNQVSVIGTGHVGWGATFFNGIPEQFKVDPDATHIGFIGDAAAGYLEYYVSDQPIS